MSVCLEKGVQVEIKEYHSTRGYESSEGERSERRIYHLIDEKDEESKDK